MMLIVGILCLSSFLQLTVAQGEAVLGDVVIDNINVKARSAFKYRSKPRKISISEENILKMANVPFSEMSTSNEAVKKIIVERHNTLRANVKPTAKNMLQIKWNDEAAKTAERYAKTCQMKHSTLQQRTIPRFSQILTISFKLTLFGPLSESIRHTVSHKNFYCGENLFMAPFKASWVDVIDSFYSENVDYEHGKGPKSSDLETGHFVQMVWSVTHQIGCSVAECPNSKYFYVCHYCPGKSKGDPYEAGPTCGSCNNSCAKGLCTNACKHQDFFGDCKKYKVSCPTDKSVQEDCGATCFCNNNEIK